MVEGRDATLIFILDHTSSDTVPITVSMYVNATDEGLKRNEAAPDLLVVVSIVGDPAVVFHSTPDVTD